MQTMPTTAESTSSPSILQMLGLRLMRRALSTWKGDQLLLTLPDGSEQIMGDANAANTWILKIHDNAFFKRLLLGSDLGFAESYLQGEWTTPDLVCLLEAFARQQSTEADSLLNLPLRVYEAIQHRLRDNTRKGSRRNIVAHYDLGNDFYFQWLDTNRQYSSAVFPTPTSSLEEAQDLKLKTLIQRLQLKPGMKVLEIGSGWGELGIRIARDHACFVTTLTLSEEQHKHVSKRISAENLSGMLEIRLQDYRDVQGQFDAVVSIEMIEAVGHKHLPEYFEKIESLLKPRGRAVIQAITMPSDRYARYLLQTDFIQAYIFPGAHCPSMEAMVSAMGKKTHLKLEQVQDYCQDYGYTLKAWRERFMEKWEQIAPLGFDLRFRRMWEYYLAYCEAGFRAEKIGLVQMALVKNV